MPQVTVEMVDDGAFQRIRFGNGRGNVLDIELMRLLRDALAEAVSDRRLKVIVLEADGPDFSFGASIQEHRPDKVAQLFDAFRELVFALLDANIVVIAVVNGRCLGGGLELASLCHRIVANPDATFAQPEIALGVFAPVGSIVLGDRLARTHAEDLCLTGRTIAVDEAVNIGLVAEVSDDPSRAAIEWARTHFKNRSATSLRFAVHAVRLNLVNRLRHELPMLEAKYLEELMSSADAVEGVAAFIEKRAPTWTE